MKINKILLIPSFSDDIDEYIKLGISNFLFPLEDYSIGYNTFSLDKIKNTHVSAFLLVNRLLTDDEIDRFIELEIPSNVVGLVVEDIGLYYALKDTDYEIINYQSHLNNSTISVNYWLDFFDSIVLSSDITGEELEKIVNTSSKKVCLNVFGFPMIMYSRRTLVSNYFKHMNEDVKMTLKTSVPNNDLQLNFVENDYGTAVFDSKILDIRNYIDNFDDDSIRFYIFNSNFISLNTMLEALSGNDIVNVTDGFFNKKTVYKIGDLK